MGRWHVYGHWQGWGGWVLVAEELAGQGQPKIHSLPVGILVAHSGQSAFLVIRLAALHIALHACIHLHCYCMHYVSAWVRLLYCLFYVQVGPLVTQDRAPPRGGFGLLAPTVLC